MSSNPSVLSAFSGTSFHHSETCSSNTPHASAPSIACVRSLPSYPDGSSQSLARLDQLLPTERRTESENAKFMKKSFCVHPVSLLRSPALHKRKYLPVSGSFYDIKTRLISEDLKLKRKRAICRFRRQRANAERKWRNLQRQELGIMLIAADGGSAFCNLNAESALKLARTSRDTFKAEAFVAQLRIQELEAKVQIFKDTVDEILACVDDAEVQLRSIIKSIRENKIPVDMEKLQLPTPTIKQPQGFRFDSISFKGSDSEEGSDADGGVVVSDDECLTSD